MCLFVKRDSKGREDGGKWLLLIFKTMYKYLALPNIKLNFKITLRPTRMLIKGRKLILTSWEYERAFI